MVIINPKTEMILKLIHDDDQRSYYICPKLTLEEIGKRATIGKKILSIDVPDLLGCKELPADFLIEPGDGDLFVISECF